MATQLQIVNSVLSELREDQVTSVGDTAYSQLIGIFVNRAKEWMEDINHTWSVYITAVDLSILADSSTTNYTVTGSNWKSVLMRDQINSSLPAAYDNTSGETGQLYDIPYGDLLRERILINDSTKTVVSPKAFATAPATDGSGWTLEIIWPVSSSEAARTWRTYWYIPQDKLSVTGSDDATNIKLPREVIELRALYLAQNERGEEMGQPGGISWTVAKDALASALERDLQVQERGQSGDSKNWNNNENL